MTSRAIASRAASGTCVGPGVMRCFFMGGYRLQALGYRSGGKLNPNLLRPLASSLGLVEFGLAQR